jgi:hypothetical protein
MAWPGLFIYRCRRIRMKADAKTEAESFPAQDSAAAGTGT